MSLPPNWTADGTEPDPTRCTTSLCGLDRARASRPLLVPKSRALIGLRACSTLVGPTFARESCGLPLPRAAR
jgi:hypothetical protein